MARDLQLKVTTTLKSADPTWITDHGFIKLVIKFFFFFIYLNASNGPTKSVWDLFSV